MKQKYLIIKNDEKNELIIQEFAEIEDQGKYTLLCEETYNGETITSAISNGKKALILTLRTISLYPPGAYAKKLAESVIYLFRSENDQTIELLFNDKDFFSANLEKPEIVDGIEEEQDVIDELPINGREELDELIGSDITIKDPTTSIALLNDESLNTEKGN